MKLKIRKRQIKEIETDLDLPVYLFFQDELDFGEYIKLSDEGKTTIKYNINGVTVSFEEKWYLFDIDPKRHLIHEPDFNAAYKEAISLIDENN